MLRSLITRALFAARDLAVRSKTSGGSIHRTAARTLAATLPPMLLVACLSAAAGLLGCGKSGTVTSPAAAVSSRFVIETVAAGAVGGPSLTLDGIGQPCIAYLDYSNGLTKYATKDTAGWHLVTVATLSPIHPSVNTNSTSVTFGGGSGLLQCAYAGASWNPETVDPYSSVLSAVTAYDTSRQPWTYYVTGTYYLTAAHRTYTGNDYRNGVWTTYPAIAGDVSYMDFAVDDQGQRHVAYCNGGDLVNGAKRRDLFYEGPSGGGTVDTATVGQVSIAIDPQGHPQLCYLRQDGSLMLAAGNGSNWTISTIATGVVPPGNPNGEEAAPSLKVDASGTLHIIYRKCLAPTSLNYATKVGSGAWKTEPVGTASSAHSGGLVLDSHGSPHIVLWDGDGVKYARLSQ
ncbi:MAG TPA: hypothetical protein VMI75_37240 [Polyangiaceae bacterium]|nr:hypothetical protein [Polyangiaceae bacterium]